jgi:hypothetical protein
MESKTSFIADNDNANEAKCGGTEDLMAEMVRNIVNNNIRIVEVFAYPIKDKVTGLEKHSFKAYSFNEIKVIQINMDKKDHLSINGTLDMPVINIKLNKEGPWYFTDKDKAMEYMRSLNKLTIDLISEHESEIIACKDYMRNLIDNDRY